MHPWAHLSCGGALQSRFMEFMQSTILSPELIAGQSLDLSVSNNCEGLPRLLVAGLEAVDAEDLTLTEIELRNSAFQAYSRCA